VNSGKGSGASVLRLWRSILRRWPNAEAVTRSSRRGSHRNGSARGISSTTDEVTLGGGTKFEGWTSNRIFACVRQEARTDSRPYFLLPGLAAIRSATSRWNISTSRSYQGGHGSMVSQDTNSAVAMLYGRL